MTTGGVGGPGATAPDTSDSAVAAGRGRGGRGRWVWAVVGLQLLLVLAGLFVWRRLPDVPDPPPLPPPDPAVTQPATLESGLAVAERQAVAWLPDARLMLATLQVDWPWDVPPGPPPELPGTGWLTYVFVAPWQAPGRSPGAATIALRVERLSGQIVSQDVLPWEQAPPMPTATPAPAVTAARAVLAAEAAGGTDYRRACPQFRHLTRASLVDVEPWGRHWVVTYEDATQPDQNGMLVRVDAATGAVLQVRTDVAACGT